MKHEAEIRRAAELMRSAEGECADDYSTALMLFQCRMVLNWIIGEKSDFGDLINSLEHVSVSKDGK